MYKSKLQELCQKKLWDLPSYAVHKEGLDHNPSFSATVMVNGVAFTTSDPCKSAKLAQNSAAFLAYQHFLGTFSTLPQPTMPTAAPGMPHMYKSQLQTYAQKRNLKLPIYFCESKGPPNACRFKGMVTVDGQTFESPEFFSTIKDAENAAARAALMLVSPNKAEEDDYGVIKTLLQEWAQRSGLCLPYYVTSRSGEDHMPNFVSTVEIAGETFRGQEAKTKKQAEINAAKVAYKALKDGYACGDILYPSPDDKGQDHRGSVSNLKANDSANLQQDMENEVMNETVTTQVSNSQSTVYPFGLESEETSYTSPSSSPDVIESWLQDQPPSSPILSVDVCSADSHPDPAHSVLKSGKGLSASKRIVILPCSAYTNIEGGTVLPFSDDKWAAIELKEGSASASSNDDQCVTGKPPPKSDL